MMVRMIVKIMVRFIVKATVITLQYNTIYQHNAVEDKRIVQHITVRYNLVQCKEYCEAQGSTMQYCITHSTVQHIIRSYNSLHHNIVQSNTVQNNAIEFNTILHYTVE